MTYASAVIQVHPFAERLRFKGKRLAYTCDGVTIEFLVTKVSMPDELGRCTLTLESPTP